MNNRAADDSAHVPIESRDEWRAWLDKNHRCSRGVWVVTFKKHRDDRYVSYEDIVEEALCFGWIDRLPRKLDEDRTMLWLAPRKAGSGWSKPNKDRVEKLIAAGLMTPSGLEKIEAAKRDGSWNTLDAIESLEILSDLAEALARYDSARKHFDAFPRSVKRGILEWIAGAKKAQTCANRIQETARMAGGDLRANQWRK